MSSPKGARPANTASEIVSKSSRAMLINHANASDKECSRMKSACERKKSITESIGCEIRGQRTVAICDSNNKCNSLPKHAFRVACD